MKKGLKKKKQKKEGRERIIFAAEAAESLNCRIVRADIRENNTEGNTLVLDLEKQS